MRVPLERRETLRDPERRNAARRAAGTSRPRRGAGVLVQPGTMARPPLPGDEPGFPVPPVWHFGVHPKNGGAGRRGRQRSRWDPRRAKGTRSPAAPQGRRWGELPPPPPLSPPAQLGKLLICKAISIANQLRATRQNKPFQPAARRGGDRQLPPKAGWERCRGSVPGVSGAARGCGSPPRTPKWGKPAPFRGCPGTHQAPGEESEAERAEGSAGRQRGGPPSAPRCAGRAKAAAGRGDGSLAVSCLRSPVLPPRRILG